jgi:hypothetical protein
MEGDMKCMNKGCGFTSKTLPSGCSNIKRDDLINQGIPPSCFTEVETVSIPASDLAEHEARKETMLNLSRKLTELRAEVVELKKDRVLVEDAIVKQGLKILCRSPLEIHMVVDGVSIKSQGKTIREAISRAIKEEG